MGRTFTMGVCALAVAGLAATDATAARHSRPSGRCAGPSEVTAIQTAAVQQELMVAALTCSQVDNFNAFQTSYGSELRTSDSTLLHMFTRLYGGSKGQAQYHAFKTRLANDSEIRSIHGNREFCAATTQIFAAALAPNKPALADFVGGVPVEETSPVDSCQIQVAVGLQGVQSAPLVLPKPRPPQPDDPPVEMAAVAPQQPQGGIKVGTLTCNVSAGVGFIFGSKKSLSCDYAPGGHTAEHYSGTFSKYGLDIGFADSSVLVWTVVAPTSTVASGALQGDYAGATASATIGIGLGANVLIGGFDKSIALQPLSVSGGTGLNIAAGAGVITLKYEP
jgi:hypothetical protein